MCTFRVTSGVIKRGLLANPPVNIDLVEDVQRFSSQPRLITSVVSGLRVIFPDQITVYAWFNKRECWPISV
jgi:hypothetical protein